MRPDFQNPNKPASKDVFSKRLQKIAFRGLLTSAAFGGLLFASIFMINLEGAVISPATVIPEGENKLVQHREGGIINSLLVKDGDVVSEGQWLVLLNNQAVKSEFNVLKFRRVELGAKLARLKANLTPDEPFSYYLPEDTRRDPAANQIVTTQKQLFEAERGSFLATQQKLNERISSLQSEITALESQIQTTSQQARLIEQQISDILPLVEDQLVPKARELDLRRGLVTAQSQLDSLNVSRVRLESNLINGRNELSQFVTTSERDILSQVEATEAELLEANQGYDRLQDQLNRHVIQAPVSGKVHELTVFNEGGVIRPGETVMKIVPQDQEVVLSAKVRPSDIDQVFIGQSVRLRFDVFDVNKTPEITGSVSHIGADMSLDEQTGLPFFEVTISIEADEIAELGSADILAGMPVTAMIKTESRTLFSYLTKPLADHSVKAFQ